ncbi:ABC transporter permease [Spiroplasma sp. SV19]|uniref:ABC transporter permease n=1 Tax=Spiroplasma sp. SV19 TaxID=2570468 RepID=UPI0024B69CF7|nr:ABC transporter permease [Spiroplasma sp. SV19]WHQ37525.1 ABC transporter permease [Spiroplasma sp. SV19]
MKTNFFYENFNIIKNHLRINWKLILFFGLFWVIITVALMGMTLISHVEGVKTPVIGIYDVNLKTGTSTVGDALISISQMLNWALFASPALVYYSIFTLILINRNFMKEINGGQISFWLTMPLSRKQILGSKILYIMLSNLIIFIPSWIIILIFSGISYDANKWFGYVFLYGLQFILFVFLLIVIYTLISICLIEKTMVANIINSLITFWMLVSWIILLIYDMNPTGYTGLEYIKYISLQSLIVIPLKFSISDIANEVIIPLDKNKILYLSEHKYLGFNKIAIAICTISIVFLTFSFGYLDLFLFKNKNLKI